MAKFCADSVLDAALTKIATSTQLLLLPSQPSSLVDAQNIKLGSASMSSGNFSIGAGSSAGRRKVTVGERTITVSGTGTVTHLGLVTGSELLYVTLSQASQAVSAGGTIVVAAWDVEFWQPE